MLEEFLERPKVAPLLAKDWVDVMIDTERMTHGQAIMDRLKGKRQGGLPWMIVLDADGKELITSNKEDGGGNIGGPVQPEEIAHFIQMLRRTKQHMSDEDVATVEGELNEYAKPFQRPQRR
ncbi:MAG: hypothetical protein R3F56_06445 [Planctomycetota bacterium]